MLKTDNYYLDTGISPLYRKLNYPDSGYQYRPFPV